MPFNPFSSFSSPNPKPQPRPNPRFFAGLDDPFNFPSAKMKYHSKPSVARSASPASTDSGYGSVDDSPLSPKARVLDRDRRRLGKDARGQWRACGYEYQSEGREKERGVEGVGLLCDDETGDASAREESGEESKHAPWKPDAQRTFTLILRDHDGAGKRTKWYSKRVFVRALERSEARGDAARVQVSMAPVLRRPASCSSSLSSSSSNESSCEAQTGMQRPRWARKESTLLHPSPPPPLDTRLDTRLDAQRGRPDEIQHCHHTTVLRSARHRSPTPLAIPTHSFNQPRPTPLRIPLGRKVSKGSVLHSCFSDDDDESFTSSGADEDGDEDRSEDEQEQDGAREADIRDEDVEPDSDADSIASGVGFCEKARVVLARTALVARAQRVRVRSPGLAGRRV